MMPIRRSQVWMPSFFNDFFGDEWMERTNATAPAVNVKESDKAYVVELAVPGMCKEDFNIKIDEDNNLVVSMEKKTESKPDKKEEHKYLRREFSYSKFQQTLVLPDNIDKENIEARVENGVLNITIPKVIPVPEEKKIKEIEIK